MSKNDDIFTTTLRLNLKNPQDEEAWDNLMYTDSDLPQYSSYTRTIVTAINDHFSRQNHSDDHDVKKEYLGKIEEIIRKTITDCLKDIQIVPAAPARTPTSEPEVTKSPEDANEAAVNAFLDNF